MGFLLVLLLVACVTSSYANSTSEPWLDPHLPRSLSPTHYTLFMQPYINQRNFDGNVSIEMNVLNETNFIIIHEMDLNITRTEVFVNETTSLTVARAFPYKDNSFWVVETEQPMVTGVPVTLNLVFSGKLSSLVGLVKTGYKNEKTGDYSPIMMTAFRPDYARMAFPNFDEPFFKSRFTIKLRHWANLTVASNMPEQENVTDNDGDWRVTSFKKSPPMSSFAISFIFSNYVYRETELLDKVKYRVWARPDLVERVDYALNVTPIITSFYVRELDYLHALRKIDDFALPFSPYRGGHACFGLITHDEEQLTINSSRGDKHRLTNLALIAFELARSYFGNVITCEQWNHIWLEQGLAAFYGLRAAGEVETMSFYEQQLLERVLNYDASNKSRPLVTPVQSPTEEPNIYNVLPMAKGAAMLKMIENFLGVHTFRRGISYYKRNYQYKTVLTQDLFGSFQKFLNASTNIAEIMAPWVYSMGYPVISIRILSGMKILARQKRFLMDPLADPNSPPSPHGYTWTVPLNYRTKEGKTGRVWLRQAHAFFENLLDDDDDWVIFNPDRSGYYRVNYEPSLWDNITKQLKNNHTVFTDLERSQVISDALKLTQAEEMNIDVALNLTMYASKEISLLIWSHICDALDILHRHLSNTTEFARYQRYVLNLTTTVMNELKVADKGTVEQKLLRQKIMPLSCSAGHRGCIENTTQLFRAWIQDDTLNSIPVNIRSIVYCSGIANSALESEWNTTFNRFFVKGDEEEKQELLLSLACSKNLTLIGRFLNKCLSDDTTDAKTLWFYDLIKAVRKFRSNPAATGYIWKWLKVNLLQIDARFYPGASVDLVPEITYQFNTNAQMLEVKHFFASLNATEHVKSAKTLTEERIRTNIRWINKHFAKVSRWLQRNFPI